MNTDYKKKLTPERERPERTDYELTEYDIFSNEYWLKNRSNSATDMNDDPSDNITDSVLNKSSKNNQSLELPQDDKISLFRNEDLDNFQCKYYTFSEFLKDDYPTSSVNSSIEDKSKDSDKNYLDFLPNVYGWTVNANDKKSFLDPDILNTDENIFLLSDDVDTEPSDFLQSSLKYSQILDLNDITIGEDNSLESPFIQNEMNIFNKLKKIESGYDNKIDNILSLNSLNELANTEKMTNNDIYSKYHGLQSEIFRKDANNSKGFLAESNENSSIKNKLDSSYKLIENISANSAEKISKPLIENTKPFLNIAEKFSSKPIKIITKKQLDDFVSKNNNMAKVCVQINLRENTTKFIINTSCNETIFTIGTSDGTSALSQINPDTIKAAGLNSNDFFKCLKPFTEKIKTTLLSSAPDKKQRIIVAVTQIPELKTMPKIKINNIFTIKSPKATNSPVHQGDDTRTKKNHSVKPDSKFNGETVSLSLMSGPSPTMVLRQSVLDTLDTYNSDADSFSKTYQNKNMKAIMKGSSIEHDKEVYEALKRIRKNPESLQVRIEGKKIKQWYCSISNCNKICKDIHTLKAHLERHANARPYKCTYEYCDWSFATNYKLKRHLQTHLKRKDFVCPKERCDRRFTTIYNLNAHLQQHAAPKRYKCSECPEGFQIRKELKEHITSTHKNISYQHKCPIDGCSKDFPTSNALYLHKRTHHKSGDIICTWDGCNKQFSKPSQLKTHMRAHNGERPYECKFQGCTWKFHSASKLSRHQKKHTNERKYPCKICGKSFLRAEHLKGHSLIHTGVQSFKCTELNCQSKFTAKSSLYVHKKKHKEQKLEKKNKSTCKKNLESLKDASVLTDGPQMDYITLVSDNDFSEYNAERSNILSSFVPASFHVTNEFFDRHKSILAPGSDVSDSVFMQLFDVASSLSTEAQEALSVSDIFPSALALSEPDSHFTVDLGLLDSTKEAFTKNKNKPADMLGFLAQRTKSKQNNSQNSSLKNATSKSILNQGLLSEIPCDSSLKMPFHLSSSEENSAAFYSDSLMSPDLLTYSVNEPQSTINLRDLE